jgi:hypothetical protein
MTDTSVNAQIPEKGWTNPFPQPHPMHDLFEKRIRNNQDLVILVDDYHARRGTGKTVASLQLCQGMNQTGSLTWENVSMEPQEMRRAYSSLPKRSALLLDEGEVGASNRDAMTKSNKAIREIMSMGRVEEKYVVINTPSVGFLDKDIRQLADVWMTMLRKGLGLIHFYKRQPYARSGSGSLLTEKNGLIEFNDIQRGTDLREVYNKLTEEKRKHISGEEGNNFIPEDEHEEKLQKAVKQERKEVRDELIKAFYNHPQHQLATEVSQSSIADAVDLSQSHVGRIVRD